MWYFNYKKGDYTESSKIYSNKADCEADALLWEIRTKKKTWVLKEKG